MMIERKHLPYSKAFHHHLAGAVRERPLLILVEPLEDFPRRTLNLFRNVDNRQNTSCLHQADCMFKGDCTCMADIEKEQGVRLV